MCPRGTSYFRTEQEIVKGEAWIALALAAAMATPAAAATLHVDADAAAAGDGTGWATAYRFLQDALAVASVPADGITEMARESCRSARSVSPLRNSASAKLMWAT